MSTATRIVGDTVAGSILRGDPRRALEQAVKHNGKEYFESGARMASLAGEVTGVSKLTSGDPRKMGEGAFDLGMLVLPLAKGKIASALTGAGKEAAVIGSKVERVAAATAGAEKSTATGQAVNRAALDPYAAAKTTGDVKSTVLNSFHPNGAPTHKFLGSGVAAKVYETMSPASTSSGRVIRIGNMDPDMLRASETASRLGLGPKVYANETRMMGGRSGYMTMDKVPGVSGQTAAATLPDVEKVEVARAFSDKMGQFHRNGMTHGDVWLDNTIYDSSTRQLKLIDFDGARPQKLFSETKGPDRFQKDIADTYRRGVKFLKPEAVDEGAWFGQFKQNYLESLTGGSAHGVSPKVLDRRLQLAREVLDGLESNPALRAAPTGPWR